MAIYYVYSGAGGSNNGSSWANAFTTLTAAFVTEVAGDTLYVAHDHAESTAGATLTSSGTVANPTKVICVDRGGTVPPVAADKRATAQVSTTTTSGISLSGSTHYDGIIFTAGSGASGATNFTVGGSNSHYLHLENCSLRLGITGAGVSQLLFGTTSTTNSYTEMYNTTVSFGGTGNIIQVFGLLRWRNTPSALLGTMPTLLFSYNSNRGSAIECIGVDLSAAGSGKTLVNYGTGNGAVIRFVDCKLNASVTKATAQTVPGSAEIDFIRCSATGNYAVFRERFPGILTEETTIVRTGGASDGVTPISWKITTTANGNYSQPFETPPIAIWNDTTGSAVTATVEGIGAALPTDKEVWLEVQYLSDATAPQSAFVSDRADIMATAANQTSSSETWGGSTAAFKLAVTFTAQQAGWIYARVKVGKASSSFYVDPLVTLS